MAKQSGLGDQLFIGGYDLGADIQQISSLSTSRETLPATGITQSANARIFGKRDAQAEFNAYFNPAANQAHSRLKLLPTADTHIMYLRGTTLGNEGLGMIGKQIDYSGSRGDDGSLMFGVQVSSNGYGADWGRQLTAGKRSDATATNGSSVDLLTGSLSFGFQAYLQVFSFTGTSVTIKIQESSDNGGGDAFADITGGAFTTVTGITSERIQSSSATQTVERYVRVVTTGTFSQCTFAVLFTRNDALRTL